MAVDERFRTMPFPEAIAYLRDKINLPTDRWDDVTDSQHDAVFVVAGAKGSLLSDLRDAVERAIAQGQRLEEFKQDFNRITEGWAHTGGKDWRASIIYGTNMRGAYAAGRYSYQLDPDVIRLQPYLQYIHSDSRTPRPAHLALDGKVFRANELPFYPPAGFGCACRTISITQRQLDRQGLEVSDVQRGDLVDYRDERGQVRQARIEPDKGFDYIPGRTTPEERRALLGNLPPDLRAQALAEVARLAPEALVAPLAAKDLREVVKSGKRDKIVDWLESNRIPPPKMIKTHGLPTEELMDLIEWEGIRFYYPSKPGSTSPIVRQLEAIANSPDLPAELKRHTKEIIMGRQPNERDAYWAEKYNEPGFQSLASGGNGQIVVYGSRSMEFDDLVHEMGHNLAKGRYGSAKPDEFSDFATAQILEKPPTDYATKSSAEDFAESVTLFVTEPERMSRIAPQRYEVIKRMLEDQAYDG